MNAYATRRNSCAPASHGCFQGIRHHERRSARRHDPPALLRATTRPRGHRCARAKAVLRKEDDPRLEGEAAGADQSGGAAAVTGMLSSDGFGTGPTLWRAVQVAAWKALQASRRTQ